MAKIEKEAGEEHYAEQNGPAELRKVRQPHHPEGDIEGEPDCSRRQRECVSQPRSPSDGRHLASALPRWAIIATAVSNCASGTIGKAGTILNYEIAGTRSLLTKTGQQLERQPGDEVVVVIFLAGYEQQIIPRQMWAGIREQISPTILAVATILVLFSIALLTTVELRRRRSSRLRGLGG